MSTSPAYATPAPNTSAEPLFDPTQQLPDPYDETALDDLRGAFPHLFPTSPPCSPGGARAARGGQRPPLDRDAKYVGSSSSPDHAFALVRQEIRGQQNLFRKWRLRRGLQRFTTNRRTKGCGWATTHPEGKVALRISIEGKAGYSGFAHCGSVWLCPVCSAKIENTRRSELAALLHYVAEHGYQLAFGTYTLRHRRGQSLETLWDGLSTGWRAVRQSRRVRRLRREYGCVGVIKAVEITYGAHGWHPHLHTIHVFEPTTAKVRIGKDEYVQQPLELGPRHIDELHAAEVSAWRASAKKQGLTSPLSRGQQLRLVDVAEAADTVAYMAKHDELPSPDQVRRSLAARHPGAYTDAQHVGFEMAGTSTKRAKRGSRTMMQLLDELVEMGDPDDFLLWQEYERVSKGRHAMDWPRGLKQLVGLKDQSDDEIVNKPDDGKDVLLFERGRDLFTPASAAPAIIAAANAGGVEGAKQVADYYSIPYAEGDFGITDMFRRRAQEARDEARQEERERQAVEAMYATMRAIALDRHARLKAERDRSQAWYDHGFQLLRAAEQLNVAAAQRGLPSRCYVEKVLVRPDECSEWDAYRHAVIALVVPDDHELVTGPVRATGWVRKAAAEHPDWPRHEVSLPSMTAHHPGDGLPDHTDDG